MNSPEIHILHKSDFYQIRNYKCNCTECHTSAVEYTSSFNLCFVRTGYFEYQVFKGELEVHIGRVMVSKPGSEHVTRHIENQPDVCTVFDFTNTFYKSIQENYKRQAGWFFQNKDLHSILLPCPPDLDYVHRAILMQTRETFTDSMQIDDWVLRLLDKVMEVMGNEPPVAVLPPALKRYHLSTVEKAKHYLLEHFSENISLQKVADHCCVSLFHFCRIFRSVMNITPYQYVSEVRLHHASILLENTALPVNQIALQCGFNSLEHFDNACRKRFNMTPTALRKSVSSV